MLKTLEKLSRRARALHNMADMPPAHALRELDDLMQAGLARLQHTEALNATSSVKLEALLLTIDAFYPDLPLDQALDLAQAIVFAQIEH